MSFYNREAIWPMVRVYMRQGHVPEGLREWFDFMTRTTTANTHANLGTASPCRQAKIAKQE